MSSEREKAASSEHVHMPRGWYCGGGGCRGGWCCCGGCCARNPGPSCCSLPNCVGAPAAPPGSAGCPAH